MRTANPAMQAFVHQGTYAGAMARPEARTMTYRGTMIASAVLTALCATSAVVTWDMFRRGQLAGVLPFLLGSMVFSLIGGLVMWRSPRTAPFLSPIFALGEGVFVGAVSWIVPQVYAKGGEGLVIQAVVLTFGILFALLLAYSVGLVRIGSTAIKVIAVATTGVVIYYFAGLLAHLVGFSGFPLLGWDSSPIGIGFSLLVVVLASLNLVLDFQFIDAGVQNKAPKYMEWYGAYGLLVTVVWLYFEALRLLAKLRE